MQFTVWAPRPKKVSIQVNGTAYPMSGPGKGADQEGYWTAEVEVDCSSPNEYGFILDSNATPFPDPRSPRQPHGVHGLSQTYDHSRFQWTDDLFRPTPLASAVVYELHVGTFTPEGTFDAIIGKLDYLCSLGVTHIELMPIASFEGKHGWGYDGVSLFAPHEPYGGPDGLKRLVDAAHTRGIAVLLDVVYNHFGPSGNYTGEFGPYINNCHSTPWGGAVNFESSGAQQVRRFFIDNALMWLRDYHIDGLRLDAVHEFIDRSAVHFLEQLACEVSDLSATIGKQCVLIAESDLNDPRLVTSREAHGYGLDAQWSDDFHHALHALVTGETSGYYADFGSISQVAKALRSVFVFDGCYSGHRLRCHGRPVGPLSFHRFFAYIQDHDQIGNRAKGDRIAQIIPFRRAQAAAAIVFASPFVPMIFQGEEWAASTPFQYFADHTDDELRTSVSEGRIGEFAAFGWDPEDVPDPEHPDTLQRSRLKWDEQTSGDHAAMLAWYRSLIHLRRHTPALNQDDPTALQVESSEENSTLLINRGNVQIAVNLGKADFILPVHADAQVLLSNTEAMPADGELTLPPDSVAFLQTER